jgi:hypothetical protein
MSYTLVTNFRESYRIPLLQTFREYHILLLETFRESCIPLLKTAELCRIPLLQNLQIHVVLIQVAWSSGHQNPKEHDLNLHRLKVSHIGQCRTLLVANLARREIRVCVLRSSSSFPSHF